MAARRVAGAAALALAAATALSACGLRGTQTLPTPLSKGGGSGAYDVTVMLASAGSLVPHSEVKVNDVSVGEVRSISFDDWHAKVVVSLEKSTKLPSNATASIAQKSLLGAEYLGLSSPAVGASSRLLADGGQIPLSQTSNYPETEQVLSALAFVLNGSGLSQIETINTELNAALTGRQTDARGLLTNLDTFVAALDAQKTDIVATIDNLNSFSAQLSKSNATVATALDQIGPGLQALQANVPGLGQTLTALARLNDTATRVIDASQDDLVADLKLLQPTLASLASTGENLPKVIQELATYPFPLNHTTADFRGDYSNLFAVLDLRCASLANNFLSGVADLGDVVKQACSTAPTTTTADPFSGPLTGSDKAGTPAAPSTPSVPRVPSAVGGLLGGIGGLLSPSPSASPSASPSSGGLLGGLLGGGR